LERNIGNGKERKALDHREQTIFRPEDLGAYLAEKDWRETFYIVQGKDGSGRETPVSRFMGKKFVLFPYEYHKDLRYGETWECQIIEDTPSYMKAIPLRKISGIKMDPDALPPMPPNLARVFVRSLEAIKVDVEVKLKDAQEEYNQFVNKEKTLEDALHDIRQKKEELEEKVIELKGDIESYDKALKQYKPQTLSSQEIPDEYRED